jgi:hypothetical protein
MRNTLLLLMAATCTFAMGCDKDEGPGPNDASTACLANDFKEGYRLIAEISAAGTTLPDEVLAVCLDGNVTRVEETQKWDVIEDRLSATREVLQGEPEGALAVAMTRAEAILGWAEYTELTCCPDQAVERFDRLAAQELKGRAVTVLDQWYTLARDERMAAGHLVVEVDGRLVAAGEIYEVVPREGHEARIGKPLVLHNVLLLAEDRSEPKRSSGDAISGDLQSEDLDLSKHRVLLARRPGAHEATGAAIVWDEAARAMVKQIHPGTLHTCEGTSTMVTSGTESAPLLVLSQCRAETERTSALFNQRSCEVCGTRDEREFCNTGHGRNDGQALVDAKGKICEELLKPDESPDDCQKLVRFTRTCGATEEPEPAP